jgi:predicted TIM-barrel fold metal-dependent hydrolase
LSNDKEPRTWGKKGAPFRVFDNHFHIIDYRFPLVPNNGFTPGKFTCEDYLARTKDPFLAGGAVVSGSFQAFDQAYLLDALHRLGPRFVGVTRLPVSVSDEEIIKLDSLGVRAVRFNLKRGGAENLKHLDEMALRVYDLVRWHIELYVDSKDLSHLQNGLLKLPAVAVDHLGPSKSGFSSLLSLVEQGVHVKATGFGRVDFDVKDALLAISAANPNALMFGTDLPSTRAPRSFRDGDVNLIIDVLGEKMGRKVLYENAVSFYRPKVRID